MERNFETVMIEQCAPVLAGLKPANLFRHESRDRAAFYATAAAWDARLAPKGIRLRVLKECAHGHWYLVYLYRPARLGAALASPDVAEAAVVPMPHALKGEAIYAYVVVRDEVPWSDDVRKKLRDTVRRDIGALASPEYIQFVEAMPKTCSGKIIRRMLRKIAGNVYDDLGDTTSLAHPEVLDAIITGHQNLLLGQHETASSVPAPEDKGAAPQDESGKKAS